MKNIVKMQFGSKVYGCALPTSDTDYKGVFIPDVRDIVLCRAPNNYSHKTNKTDKRNTADDVDVESYSLRRYLELLSQGQVVAVDMLFTPINFYAIKPHYYWKQIVANKDKLLTSKTTAFIGYCRSQAEKYGLRGKKIEILETVRDFLATCDLREELGAYAPTIINAVNSIHVKSEIRDTNTGPKTFMVICGKACSYDNNIKTAKNLVEGLLSGYGNRALLAKQAGGADLKALYHAVRIISQAVELLSTENITFPRPEAPFLLDIRCGRVSVDEIHDAIEAGIETVIDAQRRSSLRPEVDYQWIDDFIYKAHLHEIVQYELKDDKEGP